MGCTPVGSKKTTDGLACEGKVKMASSLARKFIENFRIPLKMPHFGISLWLSIFFFIIIIVQS